MVTSGQNNRPNCYSKDIHRMALHSIKIRDTADNVHVTRCSNGARIVESGEEDQSAAVEKKQNVLQAVFDSLPNAALCINAVGNVSLANHIARQRFGITTGKTVKASAIPWLARITSQVLTTREPVRGHGYENVLQFTDTGEEQFFMPTAFPVFIDDGPLVHEVIVTLIDVTRSRRVDEWNGNALALLSHELRTPLTSLKMTIGLLRNEKVGPLSDKQEQLLRVAATDLQRLNRVVECAIDATRYQNYGVEDLRNLRKCAPVALPDGQMVTM
jgi:two-component system, NtrC family, sensor histidine kinase KinB